MRSGACETPTEWGRGQVACGFQGCGGRTVANFVALWEKVGYGVARMQEPGWQGSSHPATRVQFFADEHSRPWYSAEPSNTRSMPSIA
jgi:hypothetical protein